jgi:hypothetical protein
MWVAQVLDQYVNDIFFQFFFLDVNDKVAYLNLAGYRAGEVEFICFFVLSIWKDSVVRDMLGWNRFLNDKNMLSETWRDTGQVK